MFLQNYQLDKNTFLGPIPSKTGLEISKVVFVFNLQ